MANGAKKEKIVGGGREHQTFFNCLTYFPNGIFLANGTAA